MSQIPESELIFFMGAGASVAAGVPDTFALVNKFLKDLESKSLISELEQCKIVIQVLKESGLASDEKVDIELLLETLDQLEDIEECIPLKFFEPQDSDLGNPKEVSDFGSNIKNKLQDFIKFTGIVNRDKILYLKDLKMFLEEKPRKPLDIFSVNYDVCIEQFCDTFEKKYTDGFYLEWEPESLEKLDVDVRLHKIHGSITWYRTDKGTHVKLPIRSASASVELVTGEKAVTSVLYPMRKLEYTEPFLDLLMILKRKLGKARFAFVIGYSFRDKQIQRIFWDAAKKNKDLVLILVSPSAYEIYEERLRKYDTGVLSDLDGGVICLPYKFEKVLPLLKNLYLAELKRGLNQESGCKEQENRGAPDVPWKACLEPFINCEHVEKIKQILREHPNAWEDYKKGMAYGYEIKAAFKAYLTALVSTNDSYKDFWTRELNVSLSEIINVDNLFVRIRSGNISPAFVSKRFGGLECDRCFELIQSMKEICRSKISLMKKGQITEIVNVENKLDKMLAYLNQFIERVVPLSEYLERKKESYPDVYNQILEIDRSGSRERNELIAQALSQIEKKELEKILNGSQLGF